MNDMNKRYLNGSTLTFEEIAKRVRWERNSLVTSNPNIFQGQIIPKTTTDAFPCDAITVRFHSIKSRIASAYFYGKAHKSRWSNRMHPSSKLIVTMPYSNKHGEYGYSWNGNSPKDMTEYQMADILRYINIVVDETRETSILNSINSNSKTLAVA